MVISRRALCSLPRALVPVASATRAPMLIRDARQEDAQTLIDFNARMALETEKKALDPAVLSRGVKRVLEDPARGHYYVATEVNDGAEEVIGQLMITFEWSDWRDGFFWWIQSVFVREDRRGRGIYETLHRHVMDEAKRAGDVVGIRLYVEPHNEKAARTYARLGMQQTYHVMEQALP